MTHRIWGIVLTAGLLAAMGQGLDAEDAQVLTVVEAKDQVGREVTLQMVVKSSRLLDAGTFCFLNSEMSFQAKSNFTIAIPGDALPKFAKIAINDPAQHFQGRTVRVTGKVTLHKDRPQIVVEDPKQIVIVSKIELPKQ